MLVIGITGKRGCGKDTAARYLQDNFGFRTLDFTKDMLAPLLVKQGKEVTRENLIDLAMEGRRKSHNGVWAEKLSVIMKRSTEEKFVISGIRFVEEVDVFRKNFHDNFKLTAVICDDKLRYDRVKKRATKGEADIGFEEFMKIEKKPTERAIISTIRIADFAIDNNGTLNSLHEEVENLLKILKSQP